MNSLITAININASQTHSITDSSHSIHNIAMLGQNRGRFPELDSALPLDA
jgi:hypothetical protein